MKGVDQMIEDILKEKKNMTGNWEMYGEIQETMLYGTTRKPK